MKIQNNRLSAGFKKKSKTQHLNGIISYAHILHVLKNGNSSAASQH